ncbi:hypothetical protein F4820DRAFT_459777 [Hypoxylon rubiginosum]|uniref:Uncharacterized protein n=1 Tax=Hypoxylon rubiginosum TaxID=110542 RepID=A0ACB9YUI0_9PEZI|nr:hypothetical protein F4820DRAFT_459777 [Hypoxylon rubiginosum]
MDFLQSLIIVLSLISSSFAADICGANGISTISAYFTSRSDAPVCRTHCSEDIKCRSYAVAAGDFCYHYSKPTSELLHASSLSKLKFYDRACDDVPSTDAVSNVHTTHNPPIPRSLPVSYHEANYTYEDDPLPTIVAIGTPPLEKGLPAPTFDMDEMPCVLDPSSTSNQFNILGSNFVPLVIWADNKLLPLLAPTTEAEANDMGHPDDYLPPVFFFQKPVNAPDGVYDIVLAGSTLQYIAMTSQGDAILTSSSTGTMPVQRDGQFIATSIFGVDCIGRITVTQDGSPHTWDISEDGSSTTFTPGKASSKKTMVAYSLQQQARTKLLRRSKYTEGQAPRCPKDPPDLVAKVFPGARGLQPNGCGAHKGIDFVPDLSFKACCNEHDNCYDDCENGTFETCNKKFHECMRGPGCDYLKHWYSWLLHFACLKTADFYALAVGTKFGRDAFRSASEERCGCYCSASRGLCGRADGDYHCAAINGPKADVKNCGGCGQVCSEKAKCDSGGKCICLHDQCDDRCVDLRTHPNNCGACGYKCASGSCVEGKCQAPSDLPQDRCVPVQGFANGGFSDGSKGWQTCEKGCGVSDGGDLDLDDAHAYFAVDGTEEARIATTVRMCPEASYEMTFSMRRRAGDSTCDFKYAFGEKHTSPSHRLDFPDPGDLVKHVVGPFDVPVFNKGDEGTKPNGRYLDVNFAGVVTCANSSALVALDDFELAPAQTEWNKVGQDGL